MAKLIRNGRSFPKSVKSAVLAEIKAGTKSHNQIAAAYNMSSSTVSQWGAAAKIKPAISQPVQLQRAQAALMANTAANTPTVVYDTRNNIVGIDFQGKRYV